MTKPIFAALFGLMLTVPGCPKSDRPERSAPTPGAPTPVTPAPEIIGVDLDGAPMRLSDFRGQVVAVSFWANWCVHCRDLFPHEKAMVETFKDQPFVLVGVNADEDSALARQVQEKHGLTWRSFFIGDPDGLVPHEWKVRGWPTIVLVDPAGNIRYRFEGKQPENVERAIRVLLRETAPK